VEVFLNEKSTLTALREMKTYKESPGVLLEVLTAGERYSWCNYFNNW
jgi:hypothetical protein